MTTKFFKCFSCGNVVVKICDSGVVPFCCDEKMTELVENTEDATVEKHLPVMERVDECTVRIRVGSAPHPMMKEHYIEFIYLETENGGQLHYLKPDDAPEAVFCCKERITAVYAYCNIHGLWKTTVGTEK